MILTAAGQAVRAAREFANPEEENAKLFTLLLLTLARLCEAKADPVAVLAFYLAKLLAFAGFCRKRRHACAAGRRRPWIGLTANPVALYAAIAPSTCHRKAAEQRLPAHAGPYGAGAVRRLSGAADAAAACGGGGVCASIAFVCRHSRQAPAASAYADAVCLRAERLARLTLKRKEAFWIYIFFFRKGAKGMKQYVFTFEQRKREHAPAVGRQRRQPGRNDRPGPARSAGVHDFHRSM